MVRCNKRHQLMKGLGMLNQDIASLKSNVEALEAQAQTKTAMILNNLGLGHLFVPANEMTFGRGLWFECKGIMQGKQVSAAILSTGDELYLLATQDEIRLVERLNHPNIVRCINFTYRAIDEVVMVTEYFADENLFSLIRNYAAINRPTGFGKDKTKIAAQIADALAYSHSLSPPGIHGDLNPSHVLVTEALDVMLKGFGSHRDPIGRFGAPCPLFYAPEVIMFEARDERADVFSFGLLLSYLDQHTLPYADAPDPRNPHKFALDAMSTAIKVAKGQIQPTFSSTGQSEVADLGRACTAFKPEDRPSAAKAAAVLRSILDRQLRQTHKL